MHGERRQSGLEAVRVEAVRIESVILPAAGVQGTRLGVWLCNWTGGAPRIRESTIGAEHGNEINKNLQPIGFFGKP